MSIYFAVEFDKETMKKLTLKQLEVKQGSIRGDFVQPETFHITVLFGAGGTGGYSRKDFIDALDEFGRRFNPKPFDIYLQNYGQFDNIGENGGKVVWVGVKHSLPLYEIHKNLKETIQSLNIKMDKPSHKGYTPHITMGFDVILSENFSKLFEDDEPITIKSISLWDSFKANEAHVYNKVHELFFTN